MVAARRSAIIVNVAERLHHSAAALRSAATQIGSEASFEILTRKEFDTLDLKLWAALSCPTRGLDFDEKTMDLIDADDDGRVRAPELISATLPKPYQVGRGLRTRFQPNLSSSNLKDPVQINPRSVIPH